MSAWLPRRLLLCLALVPLLGGCILVVDFDDYQAAPTSSGAGGSGGEGAAGGTGGAPQGGAGATGGSGGSGGSGGCDADLSSNPLHCGACDWDCAGGDCEEGTCGSTSLPLADARQLVVLDQELLVTAGASCDNDGQNDVSILVLPALFEDDTTPTGSFPTLDSCSLGWVRGPDKAYYAPQDSLDVLEVCSTTSCQRVDYDFGGLHINGVAPAGDELLLLPSNGGIYSVTLDGNGIPGTSTNLRATFAEPGMGGQFILYDPQTDMVWATAVGESGCVYRAPLSRLAGQELACFALDAPSFDPDRSTVQLALDGQGGAFALTVHQDGGTVRELYHIDETGAASLFGPAQVTGPLKTEAGRVYIGRPNGGFEVLDADSGQSIAVVAEPFAIDHLDPSHPDFVFYTNGAELRRWRKKAPSP